MLPVPTEPRTDRRPTSDGVVELDAILAARAVHPVFQPIVDLGTGEPIAFEALSRGPADSPLHRPDLMFAAARESGRVDELDRLCRVRALESAVDSDLQAPYTLFVNRDPAAGGTDAPSAAQLTVLRRRGLRVVIELIERHLSRHPAELLAFADSVRAAGMGIALDDVGVDADSLALMPFLMPDVVKLDMALLHRRPDAATVKVLSAVRAHAERRGAVILAEGIETHAHERLAVALGATLGQGWLYGRPAPLPPADSASTTVTPSRPLVLRDPDEELAPASPFAMVTGHQPALRAPADLVMALRRQLEEGIQTQQGLAVVLLSCIDAPHISCECAEHYTDLAASARFAAALGAGMPDELVPGLRGSRLAPDDPVSQEWDLVVVSPHFAAAIVARERFDAHPEEGRVFDYVLTYDRTVVVDVARTLMRRALPLDDPDPAIEAVLSAGGPTPSAPTPTPARHPRATHRTASAPTSSEVEVALLDRTGVIAWVNQAWDDFAVAHGGDPTRCGAGVSYLAICDQAAAAGDTPSAAVAAAIRDALRGELPAPLGVRVPCATPQRPLMFDVLISTRRDDDGRVVGATVTLSESEATDPPPSTTV